MTAHRVLIKSLNLPKHHQIDIKYWAEGSRICVAGFNTSDKQVTAAVYSAEVDLADAFYSSIKESIIESLANIAENDLKTNPQLHYRPGE